MVYPGNEGPVSSIRWELLKEGIEDFELYQLMKQRAATDSEVKTLNQAIKLATRNEDGRTKEINDLKTARNLLYHFKDDLRGFND